MTVQEHNRKAWDRQVELGNEWTVPVGNDAISAACNGNPTVFLTPCKPVPRDWFPSLAGCNVLCLASGGGQQGPILAAAGATVTVFDNSPKQLARDREVAEVHGLALITVLGDMRDLSAFPDESFDLIVHPISNVFVPDIQPVWREAYRVLRPGGRLLSGFDNPLLHMFDSDRYEQSELLITHPLPYADTDMLSEQEIQARYEQGVPLEFSHTMEDQLGGQLAAGFVITGFYEDRCRPEANNPLSRFCAVFFATKAEKQ